MKQPPFSVTSRIIEQVAVIAELTGRITERKNLSNNTLIMTKWNPLFNVWDILCAVFGFLQDDGEK